MHPLIIAGLVVAGLFILFVLFLVLLTIFGKPLERSRAEVVEILRTAAEGRMDYLVWDGFVHTPIRDPELDEVRETCRTELWNQDELTHEEGESGMRFFNPLVRDRLRELIALLESSADD